MGMTCVLSQRRLQPSGRGPTSDAHKPSRITFNQGTIGGVIIAPYDIREELKTHADVTEVYVHTTEQRGREEKHAKDYEPPLENFIEIDTTAISIEEGLNMLLQHLEKPF